MKQTMIQFFEWYINDDATFYKELIEKAESLSKIGFTKVWMPPAYKGQAGIHDVGYGVYDMYDLGEFDQKGTIPTKYGTKDEYLKAIETLHKYGLQVIADIVFNHRMGADEKETIKATVMDWNDRNEPIEAEKTVEVWTKYTFPNRKGKYSKFTWDWKCFVGTDYNAKNKETELMTFEDKTWDQRVSQEEGNFDFIMGTDVDFRNPDVLVELYEWSKWYKKFTGVDGYRFDAIKSIDSHFFTGWTKAQKEYHDNEMYTVGEYWSGDVRELEQYLRDCEYCMNLFDVAFHFNLFNASKSYDRYDMRIIFENTLVTSNNDHACAFVDNHDTQPGQALESWIESWFKLHAYSLVLLRNFKVPCVFYGDLYGIKHDGIEPVKHLDKLVWIRKNILGDEIIDQFNDYNCVGWLVKNEHPVVVVMTNGRASSKEFDLQGYENKRFIDITSDKIVQIDENSHGKFDCFDGSCSIFIEEEIFQRMMEEL